MFRMDRKIFVHRVVQVFNRGINLVKSKNTDYATNDEPLSNFESAMLRGDTLELVMLRRIKEKVARAENLLLDNKKPNHESIADTFLDIANISAFEVVVLEGREDNAGHSESSKLQSEVNQDR